MKEKFSKGSEWGKWDLHIHSDASDGNMTCEQIIDEAIKKKLTVIALTDHNTAKNIDKIRKLGNDKGISVIPGIEFKTDKGKHSVHLIALFPDEFNGIQVNSQTLYEHILTKLDLSESEIIKKGKEKLNKKNITDEVAFKAGIFEVPRNFENICNIVHNQLGGIIIVHAGYKDNSIENEICHEGKPGVTPENNLGPLKKELFNKGYIDICEIEKYDEKQINFYLENFNRPSIIASDAHNLKEIGRRFTWIKANPTFEGLKQILYEPKTRVCIKEPEILNRLNSTPNKFIFSININKNKSSKLNEEWFNNINIEFNPELTAIIGKKGSGKSALLDIIGLLGRSKNHTHFSFLNDERFLKHPNKAKEYSAKLTWYDQLSNNGHLLNNFPFPHEIETLKYIPQKYLEKLCNSIGKDGEDFFQTELKDVIFSHVKDEDKLSKTNLKDLEDYKTSLIKKEIFKLQNNQKLISSELVKLDIKFTPDYKKNIEEKLKNITTELEQLEKSKPLEILKPGIKSDKASKEIFNKIEELEGQRIIYEKEIKKLKNQISKINIDLQELRNFLSELDQLKSEFDSIKNTYEQSILEYGLKFEDIINLKYNKKIISDKISDYSKNLKNLNSQIDEKKEESISYKLKNVLVEVKKLKDTLDEPTKKYQEYKEKLKEWEEKKKKIEGSSNKDGTKKFYENELKYLSETLLTDIVSKRLMLIKIVKHIYSQKNKINEIYKDLYNPIEAFISENDINNNEYQIKFDVSYILKDFEEKFLSYINKNRQGSFLGIDQAYTKVKTIIAQTNFNNEQSLINFLNELMRNLDYDTRTENKDNPLKLNEIANQVNKLQEFYDFLFGLDYLEPQYELKLGDKNLRELSPGEKGALLLIFYLLIDKNETPLIIDQPEENLDNESVYNILVEYIKVAKKRRQIILVTHNPNLAVVCDAEQIISVKIDKKNNYKFELISGAIENPEINKEIVRILEGTMPAFNLRDKKYSISKRLQFVN